jgi:hypothetical protein
MLAFESLTPQELLKEVAEYLRMEALKRSLNVTLLDRKPRLTRAETVKRAREESANNALCSIANDLDGAGILPAKSILRTSNGWSLHAPAPDVAEVEVEQLSERDYLLLKNPEIGIQMADAITAAAPTPAPENTFTAVENALAVMVLSRNIREYLELYDPKAMAQAERALVGHDMSYAVKLREARAAKPLA